VCPSPADGVALRVLDERAGRKRKREVQTGARDPCGAGGTSWRAVLARGRRVHPAAATAKLRPENFRTRARRGALETAHRAAYARRIAVARLATPAPKGVAIVAMAPANALHALVRLQKSGQRRRDQRCGRDLRRCAGEENGRTEMRAHDIRERPVEIV